MGGGLTRAGTSSVSCQSEGPSRASVGAAASASRLALLVWVHVGLQRRSWEARYVTWGLGRRLRTNWGSFDSTGGPELHRRKYTFHRSFEPTRGRKVQNRGPVTCTHRVDARRVQWRSSGRPLPKAEKIAGRTCCTWDETLDVTMSWKTAWSNRGQHLEKLSSEVQQFYARDDDWCVSRNTVKTDRKGKTIIVCGRKTVVDLVNANPLSQLTYARVPLMIILCPFS